MKEIEEVEEITKEKKRGGMIGWLIFAVVVIAAGALWWSGAFGQAVAGSSMDYQAVFLTNDQVYFGKLSQASSQYSVLREVYYLQVTQPLQPKDQNAPPVQNINLVKLGGELHGPQDKMVINRDHILFFEDLKSDSQVVKAIQQYKESQKKK